MTSRRGIVAQPSKAPPHSISGSIQMYAQICDCNINLNLVAKDISQFSNAAAAYAPLRRHHCHRKAQHNAQSQRHSDYIQKNMENLMEYVLCTLGVSTIFEITVICGLKFHWYLRTLSLKGVSFKPSFLIFFNCAKFQKDQTTFILYI